jgi:hypothetical protein
MGDDRRYKAVPRGLPDRTRRQLERLRNLHILLEVRDAPGDNSAAAKTARLAAIRRIDPPAYKGGLRNAVAAAGGLKAGYVIRLPRTAPPGS